MTNILLRILRICHSQYKCNYLIYKKKFLIFFLHFWNLHQMLNILKEKMILIANVFPKLQTVKNLARGLSEKHHFRTRFNRQHVKVSQIFAKYQWEQFNHVFSSFSLKLIWRISALVLGEILVVIINTLTTDRKYFVHHCEILPFPIQMQLSER